MNKILRNTPRRVAFYSGCALIVVGALKLVLALPPWGMITLGVVVSVVTVLTLIPDQV